MLGRKTVMSFKVLPKAAIHDWIEHLRRNALVIGPTPFHNQFVFAEIHSAEQLTLDYPTSILPPKKMFLPQQEDLLHFNLPEGRVEALLNEQPTVVLGVHTCDMHAISLLDTVFQRDFKDQHYLARRNNTTLISIECLIPCNEHSFCKDMGTLTVPDHFDLHMTDLGDAYALDIGSERGEKLVAGSDFIRDTNHKDYQRIQRIMNHKWARFSYRLNADVTELPGLLSISAKSPIWDDVGKRCLGCGMCTIVCPTCYCFDVIDDTDFALAVGRRYREWDSCQLNNFATVAGGHDFRQGQTNRQKHRFYRKYKYQAIASGLVGCVGCGRCAHTCLVNIDPVDVLNKLYQRQSEATHNRIKSPQGRKEALSL